MSAAPRSPGRSHRIGIPALPRPPRPVILPSEPRASRSVVLAAARLRALHLDPPRHPTAPGSYAGTTGPLTSAPVFIERVSHQESAQPEGGGRRRWSGRRRVVGDFDHGCSARVPLRGTRHLRWHMRLACSDAFFTRPRTGDPGEKTSVVGGFVYSRKRMW